MSDPQTPATGSIEGRSEYEDTPKDQWDYWNEELNSSDKRLRKWKKKGDKIVRRYLGAGAPDTDNDTSGDRNDGARLNLFHSNTITLQSMLYGNTPKVDVSRRHLDANDDVGRIAAELMGRLLSNDLANNGEEYDSVLRAVLEDRLLPGLGCAKVRYAPVFASEQQPDPITGEMIEVDVLESETAPTEYFHWRDVAWGWGRTFSTLPWIGFRSFMDKDALTERFNEAVAKDATYETQHVTDISDSYRDPDMDSAWAKAEVWEIWDKAKKQTVWIVKGYGKVADTKDDPLKLNGFYPCPPFFLANPTTSLYMPTSDYTLAQDLYNEIDVLHTRISIITEAVKVIGVYDSKADGIKRMFKEGIENDLIPVDNWALFAEKGGITGSVVWVPIADIVNALDKLRELRSETIGLLQQVTGMSDIMRGELGGQYEGVGQTQMKAKFGSIRVQALQDTFAKFASDLMQLKADVIMKHFDPKTITKLSNAQYTFDADEMPKDQDEADAREKEQSELLEAVKLLKDPDNARIRVTIRAESIAMIDYAAVKAERTEFLQAISMFMQSASPLMEADPSSKPFMLKLMQWGLAGFKGASEIEGVVDKAIDASEKAAENPQPDPADAAAEKAKELEQMKQQGKMQEIKGKAEATAMVRQQDMQADMATALKEHEAKMREIQAALEAKLAEIAAKAEADISVEMIQSKVNADQQTAGVSNEMAKNQQEHNQSMTESIAAHQLKMDEISKSKTEDKDDAAL